MTMSDPALPSEPVFLLRQGGSPLVVSMPHTGTYLPPWLVPRLQPDALELPDTDWHLDILYDFLDVLDATVLVATHSRYVIDLNRPPDNVSLYPGKSTTHLCPLDSFDSSPLYMPGAEPELDEIARRVADYWHPYHDPLKQALARVKQQHGYALLWDAHSIRARVPRFFDGELPDFNIGTADGQSCDFGLVERLTEVLRQQNRYSWVVNQRFKGGYITRQYGNPMHGIHAVQLELSMNTYMSDSGANQMDQTSAHQVRSVLRAMLESMLAWRPIMA
jgi:N-formylglutamate deformylase